MATEEANQDAIINFVKDIIDRAENAHEYKPGIVVEIPVSMADIARIKQTLRTVVSKSANREPLNQAAPVALSYVQALAGRLPETAINEILLALPLTIRRLLAAEGMEQAVLSESVAYEDAT